jgi:hypothetical protein
MRPVGDRLGRFKVSLTGAIGALVVPLLVAAMACSTSTQPQAVGPLPSFTMPPEWTPTPGSLAVSVDGWTTFSGNGVELMLPPSYEGGDPVALAK